MARPRKTDGDTRDITIRVRVTAAEKFEIWKHSSDARMTISDFMRHSSMGVAPIRKHPSPDRIVLLNFLAELGKIGSNVNQIARALNRRADSGELVGISIDDITRSMLGVDLLTTHITKLLEDGR
jgi:ribosomal protein S3